MSWPSAIPWLAGAGILALVAAPLVLHIKAAGVPLGSWTVALVVAGTTASIGVALTALAFEISTKI